MRFTFRFSLLTLAFALITTVSCQNKPASSHDEPITEKSFDAAIGGSKLVMVDFYTTWCGPCKKWRHLSSRFAKTVRVMWWY